MVDIIINIIVWLFFIGIVIIATTIVTQFTAGVVKITRNAVRKINS